MRDRNRRRHLEDAESETPPSASESQGDGGDGSDSLDPSDADSAPANVQDRGGPDGDDPAQTAMSQQTQDDATQQLNEQRDKYLRLAAEYDNYRKRTAKERIEAGSRGQAELVSRLLDALDDLSRFAHVDPETTDPQTLHKGIELVEQKMLKVLGSAGLEVLNPIDQTFDPTLHEAVATEPALSPEDDHVVAKVFQPGYRFNGQLLRPARVVVKQWNG
jgi:molecular chaperone GrpE